MSDKTNKELAVDLTVSWLEYNSKLTHPNGGSAAPLMSRTEIAKSFKYFEAVLNGKIDPSVKNKK